MIEEEYAHGNRVIDALPSDERQRVIPYMESTTIASGAVVHEMNDARDWVVFPIDAVLSVVATLSTGEGCEVGTIGNEGASGIDLALGAPALRTTTCQIGGRIGTFRRAAFLEAIAGNQRFADLVRATEIARVFFIEQLVVCNTVHSVEKRCARWLLSTADRMTSELYPLTHEQLSLILGVWRPAVTVAEQHLRQAGAISYRRGVIRIINRQLLESLACECYRTTCALFDTAIDGPDGLNKVSKVFQIGAAS